MGVVGDGMCKRKILIEHEISILRGASGNLKKPVQHLLVNLVPWV